MNESYFYRILNAKRNQCQHFISNYGEQPLMDSFKVRGYYSSKNNSVYQLLNTFDYAVEYKFYSHGIHNGMSKRNRIKRLKRNNKTMKQIESYASPMMINYLNSIAKKIKTSKIKSELVVTALTLSGKYRQDSHCIHAAGYAADIRPSPSNKPVSWMDKHYNRVSTKSLIISLIQNPKTTRIFFNDPDLLTDADIINAIALRTSPITFKDYPGHDNHIHVEIQYPSQIQLFLDRKKTR